MLIKVKGLAPTIVAKFLQYCDDHRSEFPEERLLEIDSVFKVVSARVESLEASQLVLVEAEWVKGEKEEQLVVCIRNVKCDGCYKGT